MILGKQWINLVALNIVLRCDWKLQWLAVIRSDVMLDDVALTQEVWAVKGLG
jgi:hypothetical protein